MPHPFEVLPQKSVLRDLLHEVDPPPLDLDQLMRLVCSQQVRLERRVGEGLDSILKILQEDGCPARVRPTASVSEPADCHNESTFGNTANVLKIKPTPATLLCIHPGANGQGGSQQNNIESFSKSDVAAMNQWQMDLQTTNESGAPERKSRIPSIHSLKSAKQQDSEGNTVERPSMARLPDEELTSPPSSCNFGKTETKKRVSVTALFKSNTLEEKGLSRIQIFAESPFLDIIVACAVFINCAFILLEGQMEGVEVGNELFEYTTFEFTETWKHVYNIVDLVFISFYTLEMLFKLAVLRSEFFRSRWNLLDAATVSVSIAAAAFNTAGFTGLGVSPIFLRLARLAKIVRIMHVLRTMTFFSSFLIMVKSLIASTEALFWSLFFLIVVITTSAFILNQILIEHLRHTYSDPTDEDTLDLFLYYGTFTRSCVTMFEMTLGNWGPPTWMLVNHVHEIFGFVMVCYKCTAGFAMLNVINAVFLRLTMKQADVLDGQAIEQAKSDALKYRQRVSALFDIMDTSGDGKLSREEFNLLCDSNSLKAWMKLIQVSTHDIDGLWRVLDDGDGHIEKDEFLESFAKLSGSATAIDSLMIKAMLNDMQHQLAEILGCGFKRVSHR